MINLSMTWWELALIIIALAIVVGTYFLVKFLKNLIQTLTSVNTFVTENKRNFDNIVENIDIITRDTSKLTDKADIITGELESTVSSVNQDVMVPLIQTLATLAKMFQTMTKRKSIEAPKDEVSKIG